MCKATLCAVRESIGNNRGGILLCLLFFIAAFSGVAQAQQVTKKMPILLGANEVRGIDNSVLAHLDRTGDADLLLGIAKGEINSDALQQLSTPNLVDSEWLGGAAEIVVGATFKLDVFGMSLLVTTTYVEEAAADVWTYWGDVTGSKSGTAFFTVGDDQMLGLIDLNGGTRLLIEPLAGPEEERTPEYVVKHLDLEALADFSDIVIDSSSNKGSFHAAKGGCSDGNPKILVAYTPAVAAERSMATFIPSLISSMNTSFNTTEDISNTVSVAHSIEVDYTEGSVTMQQTLENHLEPGYGGLDVLDDQMDVWGADFTVLLVDDDAYSGNARGVAYFYTIAAPAPAGDDKPFAVVQDDWAQSDYTFSHEAGHILAGLHTWAVQQNNPAFTWGHGYWHPPEEEEDCEWQTMMGSYEPCDHDMTTPRLNFWSNPDRDYQGDDTGVPIGQTHPADMRSVLNTTLDCVAGWNSNPSAPGTPPSLNVTPMTCYGQNAIIWGSSSGTVGEYQVYRSPNQSFSPQYRVYTGTGTGFNLNIQSSQDPSYIRVRACNGGGCSGYKVGDEPATYYPGCP